MACHLYKQLNYRKLINPTIARIKAHKPRRCMHYLAHARITRDRYGFRQTVPNSSSSPSERDPGLQRSNRKIRLERTKRNYKGVQSGKFLRCTILSQHLLRVRNSQTFFLFQQLGRIKRQCGRVGPSSSLIDLQKTTGNILTKITKITEAWMSADLRCDYD